MPCLGLKSEIILSIIIACFYQLLYSHMCVRLCFSCGCKKKAHTDNNQGVSRLVEVQEIIMTHFCLHRCISDVCWKYNYKSICRYESVFPLLIEQTWPYGPRSGQLPTSGCQNNVILALETHPLLPDFFPELFFLSLFFMIFFGVRVNFRNLLLVFVCVSIMVICGWESESGKNVCTIVDRIESKSGTLFSALFTKHHKRLFDGVWIESAEQMDACTIKPRERCLLNMFSFCCDAVFFFFF